MDIEFHYYATWIAAACCVFNYKEAEIIAHSSQYVDDNTDLIFVQNPDHSFYVSCPTQIDILSNSEHFQTSVLTAFHFIPGLERYRAIRVDGKWSPWVTVAGSAIAKNILRACLKDGDLYLIGIATHAYIDTWAHQNFVGRLDKMNDMGGIISMAIPSIGHADALHYPDLLGSCWIDDRLIDKDIINLTRFLDALNSLVFEYVFHQSRDEIRAMSIAKTFSNRVFSAVTKNNRLLKLRARIKAYNKFANLHGFSIPAYDKNTWKKEAVRRSILKFIFTNGLRYYKWRSPCCYKQMHWYRFQEAAKKYYGIAVAEINKCRPEI